MQLLSERAFEWFLVFDPKCAKAREKTFLRDFSSSILGNREKCDAKLYALLAKRSESFFFYFSFALFLTPFSLSLLSEPTFTLAPQLYSFSSSFSLYSKEIPGRSHADPIEKTFHSIFPLSMIAAPSLPHPKIVSNVFFLLSCTRASIYERGPSIHDWNAHDE